MVSASAVVIDPQADRPTKAQALLDVKRLAERQGVLKSQIAQRERDRINFQRDLDAYMASVGPR
jgi:transcriptional regulator with XRE-family HTH domain